MALEAGAKGQAIMPLLRFGLWVLLGDMDQAYQTFDSFRDTTRQYLHLQLIFAEEGREFREDSRFDDLAKSIGWQDYWQKYGEPDSE